MANSLMSLDDDLLTAVLLSIQEHDSRHSWTFTARHLAIADARHVCRGWATLINSSGFLLQWDDAIRTLKARDRREVLSQLMKAGLLPASAAQTAAGLLRDLRLQRLPEWHEPPAYAMCDSIAGAKGEVRQTFDLADGEMEECCNLVLMKLGSTLLVASFTTQQELDDETGNRRGGFSLHVFTADPGFRQVLAMTTTDTSMPPNYRHIRSNGQPMVNHGRGAEPLRYVNSAALDALQAAAAAAGRGGLSTATLLATVCTAAGLYSGSYVDTFQKALSASLTAVPSTAPLKHFNIAQGKHDGELLPGLELMNWSAEDGEGPPAFMREQAMEDEDERFGTRDLGYASKCVQNELVRHLAQEMMVWQPGIELRHDWWPSIPSWSTVPRPSSILGYHTNCYRCYCRQSDSALRREMGDDLYDEGEDGFW